jgi:hypothetical protein
VRFLLGAEDDDRQNDQDATVARIGVITFPDPVDRISRGSYTAMAQQSATRNDRI